MKVKSIYLIIISILFLFIVEGNSQNIDSLIQVTKSISPNNIEKVKNYLFIANYYSNKDFPKQKNYLDLANDLAQNLNDSLSIAHCYSNLGKYYLNINQKEESSRLYIKALELYKSIKNEEGESDCYGSLSILAKDSSIALKYSTLANTIRRKLKLNVKLIIGLCQEGGIYEDNGNYSSAFSLYSQALKLSVETENKKGSLSVYQCFVPFYGKRGMLDSAAYYALKLLDLYGQHNDNRGKALTLYNLGHINRLEEKYLKAIEYFTDARELFEGIGDETYLQRCNSALALILNKSGDSKAALSEYVKLIEYFKGKKQYDDLGNIYVNYAEVYRNYQKQFDRDLTKSVLDSTVYFFKNALNCYTRTNNRHKILLVKSNIANAELLLGNFGQSISLINEILPEIRKNELRDIEFHCLFNLARSHTQLKNTSLALQIFGQCEKLALKYNKSLLDSKYYKEKSTALLLAGEIEKSNEALRLAIEKKDSLYDLNKNEFIIEVDRKYQTEKKEAENNQLKVEQKLQQAQIDFQRKTLWVVLAGLVAISALSWFLFDQNRKRKAANARLAQQKNEIELLNNELNHRVKNNLAFMTSLLEMQGRRTDSSAIKEALKESESRLQALSLIHSRLSKAQMDKQINLKEYLTEVTDRLQDIFSLPGQELRVERNMSDIQIDAEKAMRIGLIINELFTNSVKHAFDGIEQPVIRIEDRINDGNLELVYSDNGNKNVVLFSDDIDEDKSKDSLGLKLINLLVKQLNGNIESSPDRLVFTFQKI